MTGDDADHFAINYDGGHWYIKAKTAPYLDYERPVDSDTDNVYDIQLTISSGTESRLLTFSQDFPIPIIDFDREKPDKISGVEISSISSNGFDVSWETPATKGPDITSYNVSVTLDGSDVPTTVSSEETNVSISDLSSNSTYSVSVSAVADEGDSEWSDSVTTTTSEPNVPVFSSPDSYDVDENTIAVGKLIASDPANESATITFTLSGDSAELFEIDESGSLSFVSSPNYESVTKYSVVVTATSSDGDAPASQEITIVLKDVSEPPLAVAKPTLVKATFQSLSISWEKPENTGPEITGYNLAYKESPEGVGSTETSFTVLSDTITELEYQISGLTHSTVYSIKVRAVNDEGEGDWSVILAATTSEPNVPVFSSPNSYDVDENTTSVGKLIASDPANESATITFTLSGDSAELFEIDESGSLSFVSAPNYESVTKYSVIVTATSSDGDAPASQLIEITIKNAHEPPKKIDTLALVKATSHSLKVSWEKPGNTGPEIGVYDLGYKVTTDAEWSYIHDEIEELTYQLGGLNHSTDYSIKVRAVNAEGEGGWSETLTATTLVNNAPVIAVADTLKVNENVVGIGTITATDKDGEDVVLSISSSQDDFSFDAETGKLSFVEAKSYEDYEPESGGNSNSPLPTLPPLLIPNNGVSTITTSITSVMESDKPNDPFFPITVTAISGAGSNKRTTKKLVIVELLDVLEPPGTVSTLQLSLFAEGESFSFIPKWSRSSNTGPTPLTYELQSKLSSASDWTILENHVVSNENQNVGEADEVNHYTTLVLSDYGYIVAKDYDFRVRAVNDEGYGEWSDTVTRIGNTPPTLSKTTFSIKEYDWAIAPLDIVEPDEQDQWIRWTIATILPGFDGELFEILPNNNESGWDLWLHSKADYEKPLDEDGDNVYKIHLKLQSGLSQPLPSRLLFNNVYVFVTVQDSIVNYDTDSDGLIEIRNRSQLKSVRYDLDGNGIPSEDSANSYYSAFPELNPSTCYSGECDGYELMRNLSLDGVSWDPIGSASESFSAYFGGNGFVISDLTINDVDNKPVGFFANSSGHINGLGLEDVSVVGSGTVQDAYPVGGLAGINSGSISMCYVIGTVEGTGPNFVGGFVGKNSRLGDITTAYINQCYAQAHVKGYKAGGFAGFNSGTIETAYALGSVFSSNDYAGGFIGYNFLTGRVFNTYAAVAVSGQTNNRDYQGGFFGGLSTPSSSSNFRDSYFDKLAAGTSTVAGFENVDRLGQDISRVYRMTTAELQMPTTYTGVYSNWDNTGIEWYIGSTGMYPVIWLDFNGDGTYSWQEFGPQEVLSPPQDFKVDFSGYTMKLSWKKATPSNPARGSRSSITNNPQGTNGDGSMSYQYRYSADKGANWVEDWSATGGTRTHSISPVAQNTPYLVELRAVTSKYRFTCANCYVHKFKRLKSSVNLKG